MKAVVVELKNDLAAILSDDGCITTIKNNHYAIGQIIQINHPVVHNVRKISTFVGAAAACVFLSVGTWAYASPYSYVSMDVNPSIEFSVNRFDRVLNVNAINEDGQDILDSITVRKLKNKSITDALTKSVDEIAESGYFDGNIEGGIVITTSSEDKNKADQLAQELMQTVEQRTIENQDEVEVEAFSVAKESVDEAKSLGVTPGKLNLVEKLQEASGDPDSINKEEWLTKPVKDILKATKDYTKSNHTDENAYSEEAATSPAPTDVLQDKNSKDNKKNSKSTKEDDSTFNETTDSSNEDGKEVVKNSNNSNKTTNKEAKDTNKQNKSDSKKNNVKDEESNEVKGNSSSKQNQSVTDNNNNQQNSKKDKQTKSKSYKNNSDESQNNESKNNKGNNSKGSTKNSNDNTGTNKPSGKDNNSHDNQK